MKSLLSSNKWEIIEDCRYKFKGIRIEDSVFNEYNRNYKINYYFRKRHLYFFKNYTGSYLAHKYIIQNGGGGLVNLIDFKNI